MMLLRVPQTYFMLLQRCNKIFTHVESLNTNVQSYDSSCITAKNSVFSGFSLFVLCSVENCNVALYSYLFLFFYKANVGIRLCIRGSSIHSRPFLLSVLQYPNQEDIKTPYKEQMIRLLMFSI